MVDYVEFSQKIKSQYPQYANVDDRVLAEKMIAKYPQYGEKVIFDATTSQPTQKKGLDLTPSGLVKQATAGIAAPIRALRFGETLPQAYNRAREIQDESVLNKFSPAVDIGAYTALPISRVGGVAGFATNAAVQGGIPMALEALKQGENPLAGTTVGTAIGAGLQSLPYIGKSAGWLTNKLYLNSFPALKEKTVQRLIKPNSKALDLTEDTAQNLLMDTTERVQKDYQNLMNNAGQKVQEASLRLPEDRGVWASSLKNSLDDIYNGYSTSGIKELNPAHNNAGDIYDSIMQQIDAGSNIADVGKVSAKNLNDIMGNIKNYNINWDNSNARTRQQILKQIYGDFSRRLGNLSPELRKANREYSKLAQFEDNEGVRRILQPARKGDLDVPSSALRNYNSTVTKGNTNKNIQDLEKILIENGKQPFLNDIDDVNAAMDLLKTEPTGLNPFGITDKLKNLVERPILLGSRGLNRAIQRSGLPEVYARLRRNISESVRRLATPLTVNTVSPLLYGGINYTK